MVNKAAELKKLGGMDSASSGNDLASYQNIIGKIKKTAIVQSDKIIVQDIVDHKNISLWTKWGKRVGPMQRDNALRTFEMFWNKGVQLSTEQPTEEEIATWLKSDEGKAYKAAHKATRSRKNKSRKGGQIEKLAQQIASMSGMRTEDVTNIIPQAPLSEGHKKLGAKAVDTGVNLAGGDGVGGRVGEGSLSNLKPE